MSEIQEILNKYRLNTMRECVHILEVRGHIAASLELKEHVEHVKREMESAIRYDEDERERQA